MTMTKVSLYITLLDCDYNIENKDSIKMGFQKDPNNITIDDTPEDVSKTILTKMRMGRR